MKVFWAKISDIKSAATQFYLGRGTVKISIINHTSDNHVKFVTINLYNLP